MFFISLGEICHEQLGDMFLVVPMPYIGLMLIDSRQRPWDTGICGYVRIYTSLGNVAYGLVISRTVTWFVWSGLHDGL